MGFMENLPDFRVLVIEVAKLTGVHRAYTYTGREQPFSYPMVAPCAFFGCMGFRVNKAH